MKPISLSLRQVAPGRYTGSFLPRDVGSYMIHVNATPSGRPITTSVTVTAMQEYQALRRTSH
ncbi:MAG: hypothetical protein R3C05_16665 [Pirellulaceae bacterium]